MGLFFTLIVFCAVNVASFLMYWIDKRVHFLRGERAIMATVVAGVLGGGPGMYFAARRTRHFTHRFGTTLVFLAVWGVVALHVLLLISSRSALGYLLAAAIWQFLLSVFALLVVAYDKRAAGASTGKEGRIAEKDFVTLSLIGGFFGVMYGFRTLRHKTQHSSLITRVMMAGITQILVVLALALNKL